MTTVLLRRIRAGALAAAALLLAAAAPAPADGGFGFILFDPRDGRVLEEVQADRTFAPASVAKLATATAALALLGPDHRFVTRLAATGALRDGVLDGDLYLVGGGDPTLTSDDLAGLADGLAAAGVRQVGGRFLYDVSALPDLPEIDAGQPATAGYNVGVGALSVNFNRFQLSWARDGAGAVAAQAWAVADGGRVPIDSVAIEPGGSGPFPFTPLDGTAGDVWRLAAGPETPPRAWLPLRRPGLAAAHLLRRLAADRGIALPVPAAATAPTGAAPLAVHASAPLDALVAGMLEYSNNLSAELIGLAAARRLDPTVATLAASAATLDAWLQAQAPAVDWRGFRLANHSGLTSASRTTPRQMAAVLRIGGDRLAALLPERDEDGARPGVRAKSGTLAYAKGLAGTLRAASGQRLGFVVFVGDAARRQALDAALDRRDARMPPEARAWLTRAGAAVRERLAAWIGRY
ncbi:D-alanyl-D-alanine carboxypeptidase [Azospirillum sp. A39]|uniref:D-alanyl-D-alanine carboxypeptidase n=1 Tax=Azospirillum sp. A39 TaxID=3462279 RepID=UPI0040455D06